MVGFLDAGARVYGKLNVGRPVFGTVRMHLFLGDGDHMSSAALENVIADTSYVPKICLFVISSLCDRHGNDTLTLTVNDQMYLGAGEAKSVTKQVC